MGDTNSLELPLWNGRYETLRLLADRAGTRLYLCRDRHPPFPEVTVKVLVLDDDHEMDEIPPERRSSLEREFLEQSTIINEQLRGTELDSLLDHGRDSTTGRPFVVRAFLPGEDLQQRLTREGRPPLALALRWMAEITEQISLAHERHVVHHDIKPQNVIISGPELQARLIDFGEALAACDTVQKLYRTGVRGTRGYIAPEILTGTAVGLNSSADVYSCGLLLFYLLTGRHPFHDRPRATRVELESESNGIPTDSRLADRFRNPPDITDRSIPEPLRNLYLKCVVFDPSLRPRAVEVAAELRRCLTAVSRRQSLSFSRRRLVAGFIGCSLLAIFFWTTVSSRDGVISTDASASNSARMPPHSHISKLLYTEDFENPLEVAAHWSFHHPNITRVPMASEVEVENGQLRLTNRGFARFHAPIAQDFSLEFDWVWHEGEGTYADDLTVVFLTRGRLRESWPHEVDDGLAVRFSVGASSITVSDRAQDLYLAQVTGITFTRGQPRRVRITFADREVGVFLDYSTKPALLARADIPPAGHLLGIYNREPVGDIRKTSLIDNLKIWIK